MYQGFPIEQVHFVRCQKDSEVLTIENADGRETTIMNGLLRCARCGSKYDITQGILDLMSYQRPLDEVSLQEQLTRDTEAEIYEGQFSEEGDEMEIPSTLRHLGNLSGKTVVEFGCGTGRFTVKLMEECKRLIALDFSRQSLLELGRKLKARKNIGLVLADATQVRVAFQEFDLVLSTQVLEHIPTAVKRSEFFERVRQALKTDGIFVCTAYYQNLWRRWDRAKAEGFHSTKIFYHFFTISEIRREMKPYFRVLENHPIQIVIPFSRRLRLPLVPLSRRLEHVPVLNQFGRLILVKAEKINKKPKKRVTGSVPEKRIA